MDIGKQFTISCHCHVFTFTLSFHRLPSINNRKDVRVLPSRKMLITPPLSAYGGENTIFILHPSKFPAPLNSVRQWKGSFLVKHTELYGIRACAFYGTVYVYLLPVDVGRVNNRSVLQFYFLVFNLKHHSFPGLSEG